MGKIEFKITSKRGLVLGLSVDGKEFGVLISNDVETVSCTTESTLNLITTDTRTDSDTGEVSADIKLGDVLFKNIPIVFGAYNGFVQLILPNRMFKDGKQIWDFTNMRMICELCSNEYTYNPDSYENYLSEKELDELDRLSVSDMRLYDASPSMWKKNLSVTEVVSMMKKMQKE